MASERESERELEPLLRDALRSSSVAPSSACPDAEVLAAWREGTLPASDVMAFERHASGCARCRAMLAAFVRADVDAVASMAGGTIVGGVPLWRRWRLNWLVPIAATATALAVYVATPNPSDDRMPAASSPADRAFERPPSLSDVPQASLPPPEMDAKRLESSRDQANRDRDADSLALRRAAPPMTAPLPDLPAESRADASGARERANAGISDDAKAAQGRMAPATSPDPPVFAPVPSTRSLEQAIPAAPPAPPVPSPAAPPAPRADVAAKPSQAPQAAAVAAGTAVGVDPQAQDRAERLGGRVASPSGPARNLAQTTTLREVPLSGTLAGLQMRIDGERLERSTSGDVWTAVPLPQGTLASDIIGGVAAGETVWLVGRGGLVLRASGGGPFARVPSPASIDLLSVVAKDARTATVVASNGRRYTTTDGGRRWTVR